MAPDDQRQLAALCARLCGDAGAAWVSVVDGSGHFLAASSSPPPLDVTTLASLVAGSMAATGALAGLLGEARFPHVLHEGQAQSLHLSHLDGRAILVVIFDNRSNVGLVRLRVRQASAALESVLAGMAAPAVGDIAMREISDEDIDALFGA